MKKRYFRQLSLLGAAGLFGLWGRSFVYGDTTNPVEPKTNSAVIRKDTTDSDSLDKGITEPKKESAEITADHLEYNQKNGDFSASGRARVIWSLDRLRTEVVVGNSQTGEVTFPEVVQVNSKDAALQVAEGTYNFNTQKGVFNDGKGQVKSRYFTGEKIILNPNHMEIQNAKMAKDGSLLEEGKNPAISLRSSRVEVIPNEKMIFHKPTVYIGPHKFLQMPTYSTSLKEDAKNSEIPFPKIRRDSDLGISLTYTQPIALPAGIDGRVKVGYYQHGDFKYIAQASKGTKIGSFASLYGKEYNSDKNVWVEKSPEFTYRTPNINLNKTGSLYAYVSGLAGHWKEGNLTSWRYEGEGWIVHKPMRIGEQTQFSYGGGVRYVREEKWDNDFTQLRGFALVEHQLSSKLYSSLSLESNGNNKAIFNYRSTDEEFILRPFMSYKLDYRNQIQAGVIYDINNGEVSKYKAGWLYDLRGFQLELTYTRDENKDSKNDFDFNIHTRMF